MNTDHRPAFSGKLSHYRLTLSLISLLFLNSSVSASQDAETLNKKITELRDEMIRITANKSCNADSQCKSVGIGSRPCGGPSEFLIFSVRKTDELLLGTLAKEHRIFSQELNKLLGLVSTCEVLQPPVLSCNDGQCQANR